MKAKRIFTNPRVILALILIVLSLIAINPNPLVDGVAIRNVEKDSAAALAGIPSPDPTTPPRSREIILSVNNDPVLTEQDFHDLIDRFGPNTSFSLRTNKNFYPMRTIPLYEEVVSNETIVETVVTSYFNESLNETVNLTEVVETPVVIRNVIGVEDVGITVYEAPSNNVRKGLDLSGGTRVLLEPESAVSGTDLELIIENIKQRLNVFGLSDIVVREARDFSGSSFILVEIAGASRDEVRELLAKQGKFEAKVDNETVFVGGTDITYVCTSAECSGIDTQSGGCSQISASEWACNFRFSISISPEAAALHAGITDALSVDPESGGQYLSSPLDLFLDDELVDSLRIGTELKGREVTDISISGSGTGGTFEEARAAAFDDMKKLQTVLKTGSLPVKLKIVKMDAISPVLGKEFTSNALLVGISAILSVAIVVFIRYRRLAVSLPMFLTMVIEAVIILGVASLIGWNIDLAAIAGIIIAIGTGVDHQIVITDETLGKRQRVLSWKDRMKRAFFIITAAYVTTLVAMIPLYFAGAGLLKGFALTTIIGVTVGVFITRPAFASMLEILTDKE